MLTLRKKQVIVVAVVAVAVAVGIVEFEDNLQYQVIERNLEMLVD
jgi:hypothetical protein